MQVGLRLCPFDGTSEILVKAILQGQYCICKVKHPLVSSYVDESDLIKKLNMLRYKKRANYKARNYYLFHLNQFPWAKKDKFLGIKEKKEFNTKEMLNKMVEK